MCFCIFTFFPVWQNYHDNAVRALKNKEDMWFEDMLRRLGDNINASHTERDVSCSLWDYFMGLVVLSLLCSL